MEARHRLARLLTSAAPADPPCIQLNAEVSDLRLDVDGVGAVAFPVPARQARKLIELGARRASGGVSRL